VDNDPPTSTTTVPGAGGLIGGGISHYVLAGIATDPTSWAESVDVRASGVPLTGTELYDTDWQNTGVAGSNKYLSWQYTWELPPDGIYTVTTRAADYVGNIETPSAGITVAVDNTPPTSTITTLSNVSGTFEVVPGMAISVPMGNWYIDRQVISVTGGAADNLSGVREVYFSDGFWTHMDKASGTMAWSYTRNLPVAFGGVYTLTSQGIDRATNLEPPTSGITVILDNTPPMSWRGNGPGGDADRPLPALGDHRMYGPDRSVGRQRRGAGALWRSVAQRRRRPAHLHLRHRRREPHRPDHSLSLDLHPALQSRLRTVGGRRRDVGS